MKTLPTRIFLSPPRLGFNNRQSWFRKKYKKNMISYIREDHLKQELEGQAWFQENSAMGPGWEAGFKRAINEMLAWLRIV